MASSSSSKGLEDNNLRKIHTKDQISINLLQLLEKFYSDNKSLIYSTPQSYPVDEANFTKWIEYYQTDEAKHIASLFRKYTRHIGYNEFLQKIKSIASRIRLLSKDYQRTILMIPNRNNIWKSNFLVTLIFYGLLRDVITDVGITHKDIQHLPIEKSLIIFCDDASYSGKQLSGYISSFNRHIKGPKNILLAVPYISNIANKLITFTLQNNTSNIIIPPETEIFYDFMSNLSHEYYNLERCDKIADKLGIVRNYNFDDEIVDLHTLYFDHKLPDTVSIYQTVYAIGCNLFDNRDIFHPEESLSLIKNCNLSSILNNSMEYCGVEDIQDIVSVNKMCPSPFYKFIDWKFTAETSIFKFGPGINKAG